MTVCGYGLETLQLLTAGTDAASNLRSFVCYVLCVNWTYQDNKMEHGTCYFPFVWKDFLQ
jgi:hypothetical protein